MMRLVEEYTGGDALGSIAYYAQGEKPDWHPYFDEREGNWWHGGCVTSVSLRYHILDGRFQAGDYWYFDNSEEKWKDATPEPLGIEMYAALTACGGGHWICAVYLGGDLDIYSSWYFFQYEDFGIFPSDQQMPLRFPGGRDGYVAIYKIEGLANNGYSVALGEQVVRFDFTGGWHKCAIYGDKEG
jgi:hypothetical protein